MRSTVILIAAMLASVAMAQPASDPAAEAKRHFQAGLTHFNLREYEAAIAEFQSGYRFKQDPVFLFNIAQAYRFDNQPEQALSYYKSYLSNAQNPPNRDKVEERIRELEPIVAAMKR